MFLDAQLTQARTAARTAAQALVAACDGHGGLDGLSEVARVASLTAADLRAAVRAATLSAHT
jgi:hypothetical protein